MRDVKRPSQLTFYNSFSAEHYPYLTLLKNLLICLAFPHSLSRSEPSVGSVMMTSEAREQNEEESIKGTVVCWTSVTWSCLAEWSLVLLAMTGVGLRWKSFRKQESVEASVMWKRSNMSLSLSLTLKSNSFGFSMLIFLTTSLSANPWAHLPFTCLQKTWEAIAQHPPRQHPPHHFHHHSEHPHCHRLFGYTHSSFTSNWQLEVESEVICFSLVRQPPPLSLLSPFSFLSRVIGAWCE